MSLSGQYVGNLGGTAFNKRPNRFVDLGRFFITEKTKEKEHGRKYSTRISMAWRN